MTGEGEFNLNSIKLEEVTESFLGLDQAVKECQNEEHYDDCTTRQYIENMKDECGCLPLSIALSDKVNLFSSFFSNTYFTLCLKQTLDFFFVLSIPTMPKILYDL